MEYQLSIISARQGTTYTLPLTIGDTILIGRVDGGLDSENLVGVSALNGSGKIRLDLFDPTNVVSHDHGSIYLGGPAIIYTDHSSNGSIVDSRRLRRDTTELVPGRELVVGDYKFTLAVSSLVKKGAEKDLPTPRAAKPALPRLPPKQIFLKRSSVTR